GRVPVTSVDEANDASPAAVRDLKQQRPVTPAGIFRPQSHEIGGKLDLAVVKVYCLVQIDYAPIVRISDRHGKEDSSKDPLVGARMSKCLAVRNLLSRSDLDPNDP